MIRHVNRGMFAMGRLLLTIPTNSHIGGSNQDAQEDTFDERGPADRAGGPGLRGSATVWSGGPAPSAPDDVPGRSAPARLGQCVGARSLPSALLAGRPLRPGPARPDRVPPRRAVR